MTEERKDRKNTCLDVLLLGGIIVIGLTEISHLAAIVFGWSFTRCAWLLWGLVGAGILFCLGILLFRRFQAGKNHRRDDKDRRISTCGSMDRVEKVLALVFTGLVVSQIIFICGWSTVFRQGDMMAETVGSFLVSDGIYRVNPMTGLPYGEGIPSRLKILCLPTLYGSLCKISGCSPRTVVWRIVPTATLLFSYAAFASLAHCLFPENPMSSVRVEEGSSSGGGNSGNLDAEDPPAGSAKKCWDRKKAGCFMVAVSLLLWAGTYGYGVDGFDLLFCGYQGVVIRNTVLVPWLFSLCVRRKWLCAVLCILAEACMVWTFYGMGVCLFITAAMAVIQLLYRKQFIRF